MRIGWLVDDPIATGGAELTQAEFATAAPEGVEIVPCPAGDIDTSCDRYVIHNCVKYTLDDLHKIEGKPTVKYWHDVGPWLQPECRAWLDENARPVCCSPIQAEHMGLTNAAHIPPPVDLARFSAAAATVNGDRAGVVSVGSWRNFGKAPQRAAEWAEANGVRLDFYGGGPLAPPGCQEVPYDQMPGLLAHYTTFVFLPTVLEPFGRLVAEAWAAGCEIVTNGLVGAGYWISENPAAIETAADDFWNLVLA
jgi:glycosyltransferase involved in cell wall biosynthesis